MNEMVERVARAMQADAGQPADELYWSTPLSGAVVWRSLATAAIKAMREPTDTQWDGLARQIIFWMDMGTKTPRALFQHLERSGREIPQWLRDEPEMKHLDHVPSKGTRAVLVYRAMIDAAIGEQP